jgi:hypothetical protein
VQDEGKEGCIEEGMERSRVGLLQGRQLDVRASQQVRQDGGLAVHVVPILQVGQFTCFRRISSRLPLRPSIARTVG